jgi:hypothetical protein
MYYLINGTREKVSELHLHYSSHAADGSAYR